MVTIHRATVKYSGTIFSGGSGKVTKEEIFCSLHLLDLVLAVISNPRPTLGVAKGMKGHAHSNETENHMDGEKHKRA